MLKLFSLLQMQVLFPFAFSSHIFLFFCWGREFFSGCFRKINSYLRSFFFCRYKRCRKKTTNFVYCILKSGTSSDKKEEEKSPHTPLCQMTIQLRNNLFQCRIRCVFHNLPNKLNRTFCDALAIACHQQLR